MLPLIAAALTCLATPAVGAAAAYSYAPISPAMRDAAAKISAAAFSPPFTTDVYDRLAQLTDDYGPRFSGTPALEAAIDWVVSESKKDTGYTVTKEPVMVPRWVRGNEWATLQTPTRNKTLHFVGLGMANGTAGAVVTGPVLVVKSQADLASKGAAAVGKIIVWNVPFTTYGETVQYRSSGAVWAAAAGGIASLVRSVGPYSMQNPHTGSSITGPVAAGAVSDEDAAQLQRLQDRNVPMTISIYMEAHQLSDSPSFNIVFDIPGTTLPNEIGFVGGGHIDSWDIAEGAMDDGGGIMSSWGAVRLLAALGLRARRTIRFVMWVNEENGDRGGIAYANDHAAELNVTSLMVETDEGAFSPYALSFTGHGAAQNQLLILSELVAPLGAGNITVGGGGADIGPSCATGVPCGSIITRDPRATNGSNNPCADVMLPANYADKSLGAYPSISNGYFWFHHSDADTLERMDPAQLQTMAATLAIWAFSVADLPELLPRSGPVPPLPGPGGPDNGGSSAVGLGVGLTLALSAVVFVGVYLRRFPARRAAVASWLRCRRGAHGGTFTALPAAGSAAAPSNDFGRGLL